MRQARLDSALLEFPANRETLSKCAHPADRLPFPVPSRFSGAGQCGGLSSQGEAWH